MILKPATSMTVPDLGLLLILLCSVVLSAPTSSEEIGKTDDGKELAKNGKCNTTHRNEPFGSEMKNNFMLFPKWLFSQLNFGAKMSEIGHCVVKIW